jgi:hypothetical protein
MEPLAGRKPSKLLAAMMEICRREPYASPFIFYFLFQRLPREICVLLSEESPADIRKVAEKAER